jgi:UDP-GlcNAc:undecaprenyl-phosphate GlcNAc-1-phosphate transferase
MGVIGHAMPMLYHLYVAAFVVALGFAVVFTYAVRNIALARGWTRLPESDRHVHRDAIPRLGGVAIFIAFASVTALCLSFARLTGSVGGHHLARLASLLLPLSIVFLTGLYDDFYSVRPALKLVAQSTAGVLLFFSGFRVVLSPGLAHHELNRAVALLLTVFWTVLITNAFNLIDGLDGLAAGSALFSTMTMFVVALVMHNGTVALLTVTLAGAIVGFLRYNFNPATIFLGDSGSQLLGFMLAALSLAGATQQKSSTIISVAIPIVAFGFPIVETAVSILRRFLSGQPIFGADSGHIHHRLLANGMSHRAAVVLLYTISGGISLLSLPLLAPDAAPVAIVFAVVAIGLVVGVQRLYQHEFLELGRIARRTLVQRLVIVNNLALRRGSEALWSAHNFTSLRSALETAFADNDFDAFELLLTSHNDPQPRFSHVWDRNGMGRFTWKMTLDLVDDSGQHHGEFTVKRRERSALQVDINLLAAEFVPALVSASRRILHPIPESERVPLAKAATSQA